MRTKSHSTPPTASAPRSSVPMPGPDDTGSEGGVSNGSLGVVATGVWASSDRLELAAPAPAAAPTASADDEVAAPAWAACLAELGLAVAIKVFRPVRRPAK